MSANPQDFAYFSRGELPPWNKGTGATTGFDYYSRLELYPAAISSGSQPHDYGIDAGVWLPVSGSVYLGGGASI